jgi:hypothetical protein
MSSVPSEAFQESQHRQAIELPARVVAMLTKLCR